MAPLPEACQARPEMFAPETRAARCWAHTCTPASLWGFPASYGRWPQDAGREEIAQEGKAGGVFCQSTHRSPGPRSLPPAAGTRAHRIPPGGYSEKPRPRGAAATCRGVLGGGVRAATSRPGPETARPRLSSVQKTPRCPGSRPDPAAGARASPCTASPRTARRARPADPVTPCRAARVPWGPTSGKRLRGALQRAGSSSFPTRRSGVSKLRPAGQGRCGTHFGRAREPRTVFTLLMAAGTVQRRMIFMTTMLSAGYDVHGRSFAGTRPRRPPSP